MAALPDQFDLWVRRARETAGPERQIDLLLGSLCALKEWYFYNQGDTPNPRPATAEHEGRRYVVTFSSPGKLEDVFGGPPGKPRRIPYISVKAIDAIPYCLKFRNEGCVGILVNPGDYCFTIDLNAMEKFDREWKARGGRKGQGFWIPNMTSEEEDFWQEHGVG
jgi:hypothetical protein